MSVGPAGPLRPVATTRHRISFRRPRWVPAAPLRVSDLRDNDLAMHVPTLIEKKRDGQELTTEETSHLVAGFIRGDIADSQISAWAMAVLFQGMTVAETHHLTAAMLESGNRLEYPKRSPKRVDQHSTGGVGDKVSLVLAPLLACDKIWVPMICGQGLGWTCGTLEKLTSIPGFNIHLDDRRAIAQLESIGVFIMGQGDDFCPADKKFYALRESSGTIPSAPLIAASIMSRKLAENLSRLVLDVKFGTGATIKTRQEAKQLASLMMKVGKSMGVRVSHVLSQTDEPLGRTVGSALEVAECVEILKGGGPVDTITLVLDLAEQVSTAPRAKLAGWLSDGTAWRKFISMVYAQDGDASSLEKILEIHRAPIIHPVLATKPGKVRRVDAKAIGQAALVLGSGRKQANDTIDFAVGLSGIKKVGERAKAKEPLLFVHARTDQGLRSALTLLEGAVEVE